VDVSIDIQVWIRSDMSSKFLILNAGSSSLKFKLFEEASATFKVLAGKFFLSLNNNLLNSCGVV